MTSHQPPWRGSLFFHVIIMRVTYVISMSFCAPPQAQTPSLGFPKSPPSKKILDPPMIQTDYARTLQGYSNKQHLMLRNAMRPNNNYLTGWLVGYMRVAIVA